MSKKLLYVLSGKSAMTLRKLAREDSSPVSDRAADKLKALDRDAAVERMTEAMIAASPDRAYITDDEREWYTRDARAALDALLQEDK